MSRLRPVFFRLFAVFLGILAAAVLGEGIARLFPIATFGGEELEWLRWDVDKARRVLVLDDEMGFRPLLTSEPDSEEALYSRFGTLTNDYPPTKTPGVVRILFMGDSVTYRGKIIAELKRLYGEDKFEYWNAGVSSFNTRQEVEFYRRYNRHLAPDKIVLTVHVNDFQVTPIAFFDPNGELRVVSPQRPLSATERFLTRRSQLYRLYLAWSLQDEQPSIEAAAQEFRQSLDQLLSLLPPDSDLTVIFFPFLAPLDEWPARDRTARQTALSELENQQIRYYDLTALMLRELRSGNEVRETANDPWHPNAAFATRIALHLAEQGLF